MSAPCELNLPIHYIFNCVFHCKAFLVCNRILYYRNGITTKRRSQRFDDESSSRVIDILKSSRVGLVECRYNGTLSEQTVCVRNGHNMA